MPKGSPELTEARREEIIDACEKLYQTESFKEITLVAIGKATSFTRTSIYNYFQTKEEIFLALLTREYRRWISDLESLMAEYPSLTVDEFAQALARSLEARPQLLKIMAMNHYDMEQSSRLDEIIKSKEAFGDAVRSVDACLAHYIPAMSADEREGFIYAFFPFMFGIYPYTVVTEKQREAMDCAGTDFIYHSAYELTYACIKRLLAAPMGS